MLDKPSNFVPKGRVKEFEGDISTPVSAGNRFLLVPVAPTGKSDGGSVFKRWASAQKDYKQWYVNSYGNMKLGEIKTVQVQSDTVVASVLCLTEAGDIDYKALEKGLDALGKEASNNNGSIHITKFGDWDKISELCEALLLKRGLNVSVYV